MNNINYEMIFKRKSFHVFKEVIPFTPQDLEEIEQQLQQLMPLSKDIHTEFRLVPKEETTSTRGEYCILIYSETKEGFLQNTGYMGEQLDLWLASKDIGVCWYGLAKPKENQYNGLDFIIMLAIGKTNKQYFRKDYTKCSRRENSDIWNGQGSPDLINVVKYAPSACNSQPWYLEYKENKVILYRTRGKKGMMPLDKMTVINRLDLGIMILLLDLYFIHNKIHVIRELCIDHPIGNELALATDELIMNAIYTISEPKKSDFYDSLVPI